MFYYNVQAYRKTPEGCTTYNKTDKNMLREERALLDQTGSMAGENTNWNNAASNVDYRRV